MTRELKASTKVGKNILERSCSNIGYNLREVYKSWSREKEEAYNYYRKMCYDMDGYSFKICSANSFGFTLSWLCDTECGTQKHYVTKDNHYIVWIER